jgi:hypothetical protein
MTEGDNKINLTGEKWKSLKYLNRSQEIQLIICTTNAAFSARARHTVRRRDTTVQSVSSRNEALDLGGKKMTLMPLE